MNAMQRLGLALGIAAAALAHAAPPAAIVTDLKGDAAVDGVPRPMLFAELAPGQKVSVAPAARVSILFVRSGREFVLTGPGEYRVEDARMVASSGAAPAERSTEWRASDKAVAQVAQTAAASVRMRSAAPARGETAARGAVAPVDAEALTRLHQRKPADSAPFADRVMYGVLLQEAGAAQEAREWWARLARERGDLPELEALAR